MKNLKDYILLLEAPADTWETVIGGLYRFDKNVTDEAIIDSILHDFSLKCATLIKEYYNPESGLSSLCTYDVFINRWGIDNPGDVTAEKMLLKFIVKYLLIYVLNIFQKLKV